MSFYDFDSVDVLTKLLPPKLRQTRMIAWLTVLLKPWQWLHDLFFGDYMYYDPLSVPFGPFTSGGTYAIGDRVIWTDKRVYESLTAGVITVDPTGDTDSADYWLLVMDDFRSMDERRKTNAQIIVLETAINKWFDTAAPDRFYIENNDVIGNQVIMNDTEAESSPITNPLEFQLYFMYDNYSPVQYEYTIYVEAGVHTALGADADTIIRSFVDQYNMAGISYDIQTY
jgi:hypothetical protein